MAYNGKVYNFEKQENFEAFLAAIGTPAEKVSVLENYRPSIKLEKNGDSFVMSLISSNGTRTVTFTPGVEFDDASVDGASTKTTITVDGDTFTEVKRRDGKGSATFKREFSADKLIITMSVAGWDGVAKRYYTV